MANPKDGLLTSLQNLNQTTLNSVYDTIQQHVGLASSAADITGRWTKSVDNGILRLPRLGIVACATAFEAFVHDVIKRCLDSLYPTRTVSKDDEKSWIKQFEDWLKSRANQSKFWPDEVHKCEIGFWTDFISELKTSGLVDHSAKDSKYLLDKLHGFSEKVFQQLTQNPTSQNAVGLVQEMVDAKKQVIMGKLQCPTFFYIQQTFCRIAACMEEPHHKVMHGKPHQKSVRMKQKHQAKERKAEQRHDMAGTGKQHTASLPVAPMTKSFSGIPTSESSTAETGVTRVIERFLECLITNYASMYHWQIWRNGTPTKVKCKSVRSLKYMSNLLYGIRCILSHGSPRITVETGAMSFHRRPNEARDFDIDVVFPGGITITEDQCKSDKKLCEVYLFHVVTDLIQNTSEMKVDYDLFKTAQSFYAYAIKIIGSIAACITCKYSDGKTIEMATHAYNRKMQEIKDKLDFAWKLANKDAEKKRDVQQE